MVDRTAIDYGKQWGLFFGSGIVAWFIAISFTKFLPPSLQILFMATPVAFFCYSLFILPQWQQQGKARELEERLAEVERANALMRQHQISLAAQDMDFAYTMESLQELHPQPTDNSNLEPPPQNTLPPHMTLQQNVMQAAGEVGWEFLKYVTDKFESLVDSDGFIKVARVRSSWARNRNLNTESLRKLIQAFVNIGLTEWKDGNQQEFKPLMVGVGEIGG
jgi:hypothetical protein